MIQLAGGELEFARKYIRDVSFNVWLADRNPSYRIESPTTDVIRIADSNDLTHQIDITLASVRGIRFPRRTAIFRNGVQLVEITVERIDLNKGLQRDDLSTTPTDLDPVLSSK